MVSLSRGADAPESWSGPPSRNEGAGNAGRRPRPRPACKSRKQAAVTTGSAGSSGIPCAMALLLIRALPGVRDLIVTVACEIITHRFGASPGAPGPHDFAVCIGIARRHAKARCEPTHPPLPVPACRDDRDTPLVPGRDGGIISTCFCKAEEKILQDFQKSRIPLTSFRKSNSDAGRFGGVERPGVTETSRESSRVSGDTSRGGDERGNFDDRTTSLQQSRPGAMRVRQPSRR